MAALPLTTQDNIPSDNESEIEDIEKSNTEIDSPKKKLSLHTFTLKNKFCLKKEETSSFGGTPEPSLGNKCQPNLHVAAKRKKNKRCQISGKLEWPLIAIVVNRACLILFPSFTIGICSYYILSGFKQLYDFD